MMLAKEEVETPIDLESSSLLINIQFCANWERVIYKIYCTISNVRKLQSIWTQKQRSALMNIVTYLRLHCEFHNFLFVRPNQQLAAKRRVVVNLHESITFLKYISIFFLSCDEFHIYTSCLV